MFQNNQNHGAHEVLEVHEVLNDTINGINQFQLYQPHCQDQELSQILQNQIKFMINEYNSLVNMVNQTGNMGTTPTSSYRGFRSATPSYGLDQPQSVAPHTSVQQITDRDVASGMLGCHKHSATMRMHAALECADPGLRHTMIQGARNCADQAYEVWQYMNRKGYYQVPTLKQQTEQTMINQYQPANTTNPQTLQ